MKNEYLQPLGTTLRKIAAAVCFFAGAVTTLLLALASLGSMSSESTAKATPAIWFGLGVGTMLALLAIWMGIRLWKGVPSSNGVTHIPAWLITTFGVMLLASSVVVALLSWNWVVLWKAGAISLAMIFVGRNLARRRKSNASQT